MTSNIAVSLKNVAQDIVKTAQSLGIDAVWLDRMLIPRELKMSRDAGVIVMAVDPLTAVPWLLAARDYKMAGVRHVFYGTTEGRLSRIYLKPWMSEVSFVAVSNYVRNKLVEAGLRVIDVVHHGIDLELVNEAKRQKAVGEEYIREKIGSNRNKLVAVTIATALPRKGLPWLAKTASIVERKNPNIKFLVITTEKGLELISPSNNVVVTTDFGKMPRVKVLSIINAADMVIMPSLAEGFGLPALEAMALETPVIHAALPPLAEFSTGFTVPVRDIVVFDRGAAGPSGIEYEHHIYDPGEFADVILQVADYIINKKDVIDDWRKRTRKVVAGYDIRVIYPRLIKHVVDHITVNLSTQALASPKPAHNTGIATAQGDEAQVVLHTIEEKYGKTRSQKLLRYPGGDWFIKDHIIDLLTKSGCTTLVEVFGGSGVISAYAPRSVFKNIVYNDIDEDLVNLFRVLQEKPEEMQRKLALMPFSRALFQHYTKLLKEGKLKNYDPVTRAAITVYLSYTGFFGYPNPARRGFAVGVSKNTAVDYVRKVSAIPEIAKAYRDVIIENLDFRKVFQIYDREYTVFYCDPPFLDSKRTSRSDYYKYTFTVDDMRDLLNILSSIKGKFVLKLPEDNLGYDFIREWIDRNKYGVYEITHKKSMHKVFGGERPMHKTVLIYNYRLGGGGGNE